MIIVLVASLNNQKVISTDSNWNDNKEEYRRIFNEGAVCPFCKESIICKFGDQRIHHFTHRRQSDCPGSKDIQEHMLGKALLYDFFKNVSMVMKQRLF